MANSSVTFRGKSVEWDLTGAPPPAWESWLNSLDGGFFHAPLALSVGAPAGDPVYCTLRDGEETIGIALGVLSRCRLDSTPRHIYFPTLPALSVVPWRDRALAALIDRLDHQGVAEVTMDSFDARWVPDGLGSDSGRERVEHLVPLGPEPESLLERFGATHRRNCRRGQREGWAFEHKTGNAARAAVTQVLESAAGRAREQGRGFAPGLLTGLDRQAGASPGGGGELRIFVVITDDDLLAAAMVGVAGCRGFYIMGGSTPEGYRRRAAVWLHYRVMTWLIERGCKVYNLGGTPTAAANPTDPGHGLYRFKAQFGGEVVPCRNVRRVLRPAHVSLHRFAGRIGGVFR